MNTMRFSFSRWLFIIGLLFHLCAPLIALPVPDDDSNATKNSSSTETRRIKITTGREKQKLLLILLDGFRWDYPSKSDGLEAFKRIKTKGVMAKYLVPVFPTMSFPNYQSLVTGRYPENHGIIMNYMYDEKRSSFFEMLPSDVSTRSFWWNESEPIWIGAQKASLRTYLYGWPGCDVVFNETVKPTFCEPYKFHSGLETFQNHVDEALSKLIDGDADLAQIYLEHADYVGHMDGPDSMRLTMALKDINDELNILLDMIQEFAMEKKTTKTTSFRKSKLKKKTKITYVDKVKLNVIIVSDHGMTATDDRHVKRISLDAVLNLDDVHLILGEGATVGVYPRDGRINKVYETLQPMEGIHVWKKEDIPESFHMKNHTRTPPIFVLAKKGYFIESIKNNDKQFPRAMNSDTGKYKGYHGYDPEEVHDMRGIFYAFGPGFERNMVMPSINMVDVYNIMSHLLDMEPQPNNGTWKTVFKYLRPTSAASSHWCDPFSTIVVMCLVLVYTRFIGTYNLQHAIKKNFQVRNSQPNQNQPHHFKRQIIQVLNDQ